MKLFNKVAIIGVGLIGGSLGLGIKKRRLAGEVIGISRHQRTIDSAIKRAAIDRGSLDIKEINAADLVILAAPVNSIIRTGLRLPRLIRPGSLVTDTGSSKDIVVSRLEKVLSNFVGAHPLAGSEKQGVMNADADLFCGSLCVLTPTAKTSKTALTKIRRLWRALGARVVCLSPARHDRLIAYVSHLPHIIACSLIKSVPRNSLYFASSGLRDTTRIAASPAAVWKDILLTNPENVLRALDEFAACLSRIKSAVKKGDARRLEQILEQVKSKREILNHK
jgi:prephenate dehydrogenase